MGVSSLFWAGSVSPEMIAAELAMARGVAAGEGDGGTGATIVSADPSRQVPQWPSRIEAFGEGVTPCFGTGTGSGDVSEANLAHCRVCADAKRAVEQEDMTMAAVADSSCGRVSE